MNDLKGASKEIHQYLLDNYKKNLMKIEMDLYAARQTRMLNKIQRYFNSTPLRNAFARWMAYAYYESKFFTITQLVNEMYSNRQSISQIINECETENYIVVQRKGRTVACQASTALIEKIEDYCNWRKSLTKDTIDNSYYSLIQFEHLINKEFNKSN